MLRSLALVALMGLAACSEVPGGSSAATGSAGESGSAATAPEVDLFAFAAGTIAVQSPDDSHFDDLNYGTINLIDESSRTDWTTSAAGPATVVFELPERTQLNRLGFDSASLVRAEKSPRTVKVEISDISASDGFQTILETELKPAEDGQSFPVSTKLPGRWVRLTLVDNNGDEYFGLTGFRGYGEQLTQSASLPELTGTYQAPWGQLRLRQEGTRVTGCYDLQEGIIAGGIEGRMLVAELTETTSDGTRDRKRGFFSFANGGQSLFGVSRAADAEPDAMPGIAYAAQKISGETGECPDIPGWSSGQVAKSQLAQEIVERGRARLDGINFDFNAATIHPESRTLLDQIVRLLKDNPDWKVTLEGHTDNVGGEAFNADLSERRAAAMKSYLADHGVGPDRVATAGFGYSRPVASNDTQMGRAQNRRVEIAKR